MMSRTVRVRASWTIGIAGAIVFLWSWSMIVEGSRQPVPDLRGRELVAAMELLEARGFEPEVFGAPCQGADITTPGFFVNDQRPEPGTLHRSGVPVEIAVEFRDGNAISSCGWGLTTPSSDFHIGELFALVWITSTILVGVDAHRKGERGWLWALGCFALWIVVFPIWLIIRWNLPRTAPPEEEVPRILEDTRR
jgi:hypothetical protein